MPFNTIELDQNARINFISQVYSHIESSSVGSQSWWYVLYIFWFFIEYYLHKSHGDVNIDNITGNNVLLAFYSLFKIVNWLKIDKVMTILWWVHVQNWSFYVSFITIIIICTKHSINFDYPQNMTQYSYRLQI